MQTSYIAHLACRVLRLRVVRLWLTCQRPLLHISLLLSVRLYRHDSLRIKHAFYSWSILILRNWISLNSLNLIALLTGICQAAQNRLWMVLGKHLVVHVELFDCISTNTCKALGSHQVYACCIELAKLHCWVEQAIDIAFIWNFIHYQFCFSHRKFNVELSDLRNFQNQVCNEDIVVDFENDSHRLIIVHVVIALCKLGQMSIVSVRLTAMHSLQGASRVGIRHGKATTFRISFCVWIDSMETLKCDVSSIIFHDLIVKNVFHTIRYAINYDRDCLLWRLWER